MVEYNKRPDMDASYVDAEQVSSLLMGGQEDKLHGFDVYVMTRVIGPAKGREPFFFVDDPETQKVVLEVDDDLTNQDRDFGVGVWLDQTMEEIDAVTVSTPHLKRVMKERYNKPTYYLPNYLRTDFYRDVSMRTKRNHEDVITIGVVGTKTHWGDYRLVLPALKRLKEKHGDKILFVVGHYLPEYLKQLGKINFIPGQTYELYPGMIRQLDIRLCPLESDEPFNDSKSPIAALEAMACGRPTSNGVGGAVAVCSDHLVYRGTVNDGSNGFLVKDGNWFEVLDQLVSDKELREKVSEKGHRWVVKNRDIRDHSGEWVAAYRKILGR